MRSVIAGPSGNPPGRHEADAVGSFAPLASPLDPASNSICQSGLDTLTKKLRVLRKSSSHHLPSDEANRVGQPSDVGIAEALVEGIPVLAVVVGEPEFTRE